MTRPPAAPSDATAVLVRDLLPWAERDVAAFMLFARAIERAGRACESTARAIRDLEKARNS